MVNPIPIPNPNSNSNSNSNPIFFNTPSQFLDSFHANLQKFNPNQKEQQKVTENVPWNSQRIRLGYEWNFIDQETTEKVYNIIEYFRTTIRDAQTHEEPKATVNLYYSLDKDLQKQTVFIPFFSNIPNNRQTISAELFDNVILPILVKTATPALDNIPIKFPIGKPAILNVPKLCNLGFFSFNWYNKQVSVIQTEIEFSTDGFTTVESKKTKKLYIQLSKLVDLDPLEKVIVSIWNRHHRAKEA